MGATFDWTFPQTFEQNPDWQVDGLGIPSQQSEVATPTTLTLQWRVTTDVLTNKLRPLKSDEGKVNILRTDDGGFTAVDRANGDNTYTLRPPDRRQPLRFERDYHVNRYEEELISQDVGEWSVEVEFIKSSNRTDSNVQDRPVGGATFPMVFDATFERQSSAGWGFTTPSSVFWTDRVDAEFLGTGEDGVERFELTARLTFNDSHTFESDYAKLAGARVRDIPDAANLAVDDTNGAATLTIDSPDTAVISDGEFVIIEPWESTRLSEAYQALSMTIAGA
jgi:hypothetical protein